SLKTSIKTITYLSDIGCLEIQGASLIIVVRASRTGNGVVPLDKGQPGLVSDSLNPAKARVLLMTALTQTRNPELIQSYFSTY
ncbi:L-asparaginase, partial [Salmonella enterica]|nr:L-asparaginase [Salmonella enterica]